MCKSNKETGMLKKQGFGFARSALYGIKKKPFHRRKPPFFREKLPNVPGFSEDRHRFYRSPSHFLIWWQPVDLVLLH
jgi:hypothetical protein